MDWLGSYRQSINCTDDSVTITTVGNLAKNQHADAIIKSGTTIRDC